MRSIIDWSPLEGLFLIEESFIEGFFQIELSSTHEKNTTEDQYFVLHKPWKASKKF